MRAVTFQAPGVVSVEERPEPELLDPEDAVLRIEATGVCGSDLHIYHGRVQIEPGFTIGHEYVGTVVAAGDAVTRAAVGDRVPERARVQAALIEAARAAGAAHVFAIDTVPERLRVAESFGAEALGHGV